MTRRSPLWIGLALTAVGIGGLLLTGAAGAILTHAPRLPLRGVHGYGGMMGGQRATPGSGRIGASGLAALVAQGQAGAHRALNSNTVTYGGTTATIVALASPHGQPAMTWEIDGLVNPTVVVQPGSRITVDVVNTDMGYRHGFEVTRTPPPYPSMLMMRVPGDVLVMPLPPRTTRNLATARYAKGSGTLTLSAGTYNYLCPVPRHAARGMHGKLVVQAV